jgi:hypothetical protein
MSLVKLMTLIANGVGYKPKGMGLSNTQIRALMRWSPYSCREPSTSEEGKAQEGELLHGE